MIIAIIILSVLFAAATFTAVLGWYGCIALNKDLKASESLIDECEKALADAKEEINKKISYIDPSTILVGTAICDVEYNAGTLGEVIDLSQYSNKGLIGVKLLTPDPCPH